MTMEDQVGPSSLTEQGREKDRGRDELAKSKAGRKLSDGRWWWWVWFSTLLVWLGWLPVSPESPYPRSLSREWLESLDFPLALGLDSKQMHVL